MSPYQRAEYACSADWEVHSLKSMKEQAEAGVNETEAVIAQGYRLHQSCRQVYVPTVSGCVTTIGGATTCTHSSKKETVCEDVPVAIDGALEKEKLRKYRSAYKNYSAKLTKKMNACIARVRVLSVQEAFDYYERVR